MNKNLLLSIIVHYIFLLVISCVFLVGCSDSRDKTPFEPEFIGTDITPVTSKAGGIAILGGTVQKYSASIGFSFNADKSGASDVFIRLGTSDSTYLVEECLNKYPGSYLANVKNRYEFPNGLISGKTYIVWIIRKIGVSQWQVQSSFTTDSNGE